MNENSVLSIVICTRNRATLLYDCLLSLEEQETARPFEIVVVDNSSEDNTAALVHEFTQESTWPIQYVCEYRLGLSYARNTGIQTASGDLIAFIDDDVIVNQGWAQAIIDGHDTYGADCVAGRVLPKLLAPEPSWLQRWKRTRGMTPIVWGYCDFGDEPKEMLDPKFVLPGQNMSFRRQVFEKIGLFDVTLGRKDERLFAGEDEEISRRARAKGFRFFYMPEAFLWHKVPAYKMTRRYMLKLAWDSGLSDPVHKEWPCHSLLNSVVKATIEWVCSPQLYYFKNLATRCGHLWGKLTWQGGQ